MGVQKGHSLVEVNSMEIDVRKTPKGQSEMDNPEILATMRMQDEEYKCVGHDYGQKIW